MVMTKRCEGGGDAIFIGKKQAGGRYSVNEHTCLCIDMRIDNGLLGPFRMLCG